MCDSTVTTVVEVVGRASLCRVLTFYMVYEEDRKLTHCSVECVII